MPRFADLISRAVAVLRRGGIVCYPTETFYGLAVSVWDHDAVDRVIAAKGRRPDAPIAAIAPDAPSAFALWRQVPAAARALAGAHWPGALTIVCEADPRLPAALVGPLGVGVRVSSHHWAQLLAQAFGGAVTATSANLAGSPPAVTCDEARAQLGDAIDLYLDGGATPGETPSTVVAVRKDDTLQVIRQGAVTL